MCGAQIGFERRIVSTASKRARADQLWLAPSCSLIALPVDLEHEQALDPELRDWLAFAVRSWMNSVP